MLVCAVTVILVDKFILQIEYIIDWLLLNILFSLLGINKHDIHCPVSISVQLHCKLEAGYLHIGHISYISLTNRCHLNLLTSTIRRNTAWDARVNSVLWPREEFVNSIISEKVLVVKLDWVVPVDNRPYIVPTTINSLALYCSVLYWTLLFHISTHHGVPYFPLHYLIISLLSCLSVVGQHGAWLTLDIRTDWLFTKGTAYLLI